MGLLDSFNDKLGKYLGLKKQDAIVQIFEETESSEPLAVPAQAGGKNIKPKEKAVYYGKEASDEVLEKEIGNLTEEDERERARKEALAQLEKEAADVSDEIKP